MCRWGLDAISIYNGPPADHLLNMNVLGAGHRHLNLAGDYRGCQIDLTAGIPQQSPPRGQQPLFYLRRLDVRCHVCADFPRTIFRGEEAIKLGLKNPQPAPIGSLPRDWRWPACVWCERELWLDVGCEPTPVTVCFPIQSVTALDGSDAEWQWCTDFLPFNILGMEEILDKYMLSFTPEALFVIGRKPGERQTTVVTEGSE